ncbi:MAG: ATP-dependent zinc metalloprotease FtsH [Pseudomonadota bacterium]
MNKMSRNLAIWVIIFLFIVVLFNLFRGPEEEVDRKFIDYSNFLQASKDNSVSSVEINKNTIKGTLTDGSRFVTNIPPNSELAERLSSQGISVKGAPNDDDSPSFIHILLSWLPMLLLIGIWIFFLRQMQSGSNRAMGFGKSRARMLTESSTRVTFKDVAGVDEAKQEIEEIVEFLKDPHKFQRIGGKIPKGVLLVGSPGTGKTLLAKAIAGEAEVPFFSISGSDFVEMFVGVGASRVRDMFEQAKKNAPCIIFVDELDAVGRHRGAGLGGGNDEREQTLNQLLVEMDGFEENAGVILIAATNRPDVLDPALLRPGRFDRQVIVPMPDLKGREQILAVHLKKITIAKDVNRAVLARGTPGFSGADLENLVNEGALLAARYNKRVVSMADLEEAKDKVMMGTERRSLAMTDEEKSLTAYHEAGHALVGHYSPASDPIHKATIIPRGLALGMVVRLPETDRVSQPRDKLEADLAVAMGGRLAEELIFGPQKITTGASSDIQGATKIARRMVTEWGMSEKLGPLIYGEPTQEVFLGHSVTQHKNISEATAQLIDQEVRKIIDLAYATAKSLLEKHLDGLHILAKALLEYESITGKEIHQLLDGKSLNRTTRNPSRKTPKKRTTKAKGTKATPPKLKPKPQPGT